MQLVMKGGNTYFMPANEGHSTSITSVMKWDQAFHVFSDIYCNFHPNRSTEPNSIQFMLSTLQLQLTSGRMFTTMIVTLDYIWL